MPAWIDAGEADCRWCRSARAPPRHLFTTTISLTLYRQGNYYYNPETDHLRLSQEAIEERTNAQAASLLALVNKQTHPAQPARAEHLGRFRSIRRPSSYLSSSERTEVVELRSLNCLPACRLGCWLSVSADGYVTVKVPRRASRGQRGGGGTWCRSSCAWS